MKKGKRKNLGLWDTEHLGSNTYAKDTRDTFKEYFN